MNARIYVGLVCTGIWAAASPNAYAQQQDCSTAQFSEEFLEQFPNARESCLEVITREGQDYAVFRARLDQVRGNTAFVRFEQPDGSRGPRTRIDTPSDFRVLIDGEPTPLRNVATNQEITAYVQVDRPMVALEGATKRLHVVPFVVVPMDQGERTRLAAAEEGEATMPSTAGPGPIIAILGALLMAGALGARGIRRLRRPH
jgi:hypothetical protein